MNRLISAVLLVIFPWTSFAAVAYRAPGSRAAEFNAWLNAYADATPAVQMNVPSPDAKEKLNSVLETAQRLFLEGSLTDARAQYRRLTEFARAEDWATPQRRAIHFAFLRLAQISENEADRSAQLRSAAEYAPDLPVDPTLFPPPVLADYKKIHDAVAKQALNVQAQELYADFDILVLDGRKIDIRDSALVRAAVGNHRVTLLSNAFAPVTATLTAQQMQVFHPSARALISGSCESPAWVSGSDHEAIVYYSQDCQYRFKSGQWSRLNQKQAVQENTWAQLKSLHDPNILDLPKPQTRSLLKSKWFWAGVAGAALAAVVISQRASASEPQVVPSEQHGY